MRKQTKAATILGVVLSLGALCSAAEQMFELARHENQFTSVRVEPARMAGKPGIAVVFEGTNDLHYYAKKETAAVGFNLTVTASADSVTFGETVLPKWKIFQDPTGADVEVFVGDFSVFIPIEFYPKTASHLDINVKISAITCTSEVCLMPFEHTLTAKVNIADSGAWEKIDFDTAAAKPRETAETVVQGASYTVPVALVLAVLVGLMFNIMPCVLPVIPLIIARLLDQAKQGKSRSIALGFIFCGGILCFFALIAVTNIVLQLVYGTVFQWGDHFRNPVVIVGMSLVMMVLGLFMFDVFTIGIPSSVTSKAGSGKGAAGAFGMGFLAALLSTPCSFGILAGVFAWAQTQPLSLSTLAFILMGVGMAIPYAILVSIPSLLASLPRPGTWMEIVKKSMGFILLIIAVKLIGALGKDMVINLLYYSVILSFCLWMWGGWVGFSTAAGKKWTVRIIALTVAVTTGWALLPEKTELVNWQEYDAVRIAQARQERQPVLIKFTAEWCTSCSWVDRTVYQRKEVAELINQKGILAIKADTTKKDSPATIDLADKDKYNEPGVPVTVLLLPDGGEVHMRGVISKNDLKKALDALPDAAD